MRRRVRKRVRSKKPQKKQAKKVPKSRKGKDGPLTLKLHMTDFMLQEEVGLLVAVGDGLLYRVCKQDGSFGQRMGMCNGGLLVTTVGVFVRVGVLGTVGLDQQRGYFTRGDMGLAVEGMRGGQNPGERETISVLYL